MTHVGRCRSGRFSMYCYRPGVPEDRVVDLGIDGVEDATPVGAGGVATVYRAQQPDLSRTVAVKVIQAAGDEATLRRFKREARALGSLSEHPGIVTVYDLGTTPAGQPYFIMQYCPSGSLQDRLTNEGRLPVDEACAVVSEISQTLADAHDLDIVHRDLKPANILIDTQGRHLVADFGIAALADTSGGVSAAVSYTAGYAPPETLRGDPPSPSGEVYSLGATLYSLVTGRVPFSYSDGDSEPNVLAILARIGSEPLEDTRPYGVPDEIASVIERCTSKAADERPGRSTKIASVRISTTASTCSPSKFPRCAVAKRTSFP